MTTIERQITQIDGANVPVPTQNGFSSTKLEVFPDDASFEAVYGAGTQGSKYFNSTQLLEREHDGTGWISVSKALNAVEDSSTTGSDNDLSATRFDLIRFTEESLVSVRSIDPAQHKILYLANGQSAQTITLLNEDGAATAQNRIVTGTGDNLILEPGTIIPLVYDTIAERWLVAGGAGSGGGGLEIEVITDADSPVTAEIAKWYVTDTSAGEIIINLPDLSAIPGSKQASAAMRFSDCKDNWHIYNVTLQPFSGQSIAGQAADESYVLDVQGQNVQIAMESASNWCLDTNIQPVLEGDGGGTGSGAKNFVIDGDTANEVTDVGGAVSITTTTIADIPENETKENGCLCTISGGSIGDTSTWNTLPVDEGNNGQMGAADGYWKTKAGYADGAASIRWINTDTSVVQFSYDIPADSSGRISMIGDALKGLELIAGENIQPQLYWNVTDETNGIVFSGMGSLAQSRLQGGLNTDWTGFTPGSSQGLGALTNVQLQERLNGPDQKIKGRFTLGATSAVEARLELPYGRVASFTDATGLVFVGEVKADAASAVVNIPVFAQNGLNYLTFGRYVDGGSTVQLSNANGDDIFVNTSTASIDVTVPTTVDGSIAFGDEMQGQNTRVGFGITANQGGKPDNLDTDIVWDRLDYNEGGLSYNDSTGVFTVEQKMDLLIAFGFSNSHAGFSNSRARIRDASNNILAFFGSNYLPARVFRFEVGDTFKATAMSNGSGTWTLLNDTGTYITIARYSDKSSSATGFPFADQHLDEYGMIKMDYDTVAADGDYTSGSINYLVQGKSVTVSSTATLAHPSANSASTSAGFLPEKYRPSVGKRAVYETGGSAIAKVTVGTDGSVSTSYRNYSGTPTSFTASLAPFTITYDLL